MSRQLILRSVTVLAGLLPMLCAVNAFAGEIRYLAWDEQHRRAAIETAAGARHVELGDSIPGLGSVVALDDTLLVVRRVLSEAERAQLAEQGLTDYWAEQVEVIREDLLFHGIPIAPSGANQ